MSQQGKPETVAKEEAVPEGDLANATPAQDNEESIQLERAEIEAITRLSLRDEWTLLERRIMKTLRSRRRARALVADTNEWLRDFIARRGEASREMAGNTPQEFEDLRRQPKGPTSSSKTCENATLHARGP
ncbi:hypothetical protein TKK_0002373 [Trichogramma kaykai]